MSGLYDDHLNVCSCIWFYVFYTTMCLRDDHDVEVYPWSVRGIVNLEIPGSIWKHFATSGLKFASNISVSLFESLFPHTVANVLILPYTMHLQNSNCISFCHLGYWSISQHWSSPPLQVVYETRCFILLRKIAYTRVIKLYKSAILNLNWLHEVIKL